jgi:hypothetical protein
MMKNRNHQRQRVLKAGLIAFNGSGIDCLIRNISAGGASLQVESQIGIPSSFDLVIGADKFNKSCRVCWRKENRIGVKFDATSSEDEDKAATGPRRADVALVLCDDL